MDTEENDEVKEMEAPQSKSFTYGFKPATVRKPSFNTSLISEAYSFKQSRFII